MVSDIQPKRLSLAEAMRLREEVGGLLNRLMADREASERRQAEAGKRDPMKFVTGKTALEEAIAKAREMICQVDVLLSQLTGDSRIPPTVSILKSPMPAPHRGFVRPVGRSTGAMPVRALPVAGRP
jgi:hypothetical protein